MTTISFRMDRRYYLAAAAGLFGGFALSGVVCAAIDSIQNGTNFSAAAALRYSAEALIQTVVFGATVTLLFRILNPKFIVEVGDTGRVHVVDTVEEVINLLVQFAATQMYC
eukprot:UN09451